MIDYDKKQTTLLVSTPGIIREATAIMLASIPQVGQVKLASGALSAIELLQDGHSYVVVIDANLPAEEVVCLVRWSKQHQPDTSCIVLAKSTVDLEQARAAGADAAFLRSSSARQLADAVWPKNQAEG